MDGILAIGLGLGLRLLVDVVSNHNLRVAGTIIGLWEGVVLQHFLSKMPRSYDPYVGYGFRLWIDFLFTESFFREVIVVLWTGIGMVLYDLGPPIWSSTGLKYYYRNIVRTLWALEFPSSVLSLFYKPPRVRFYTIRPPRIAPSLSSSSSASPSSPTPVLTRRPPGALPGAWSDNDTTVSILPVPPPSSSTASPRRAPSSNFAAFDVPLSDTPAPLVVPPAEQLLEIPSEQPSDVRQPKEEITPTRRSVLLPETLLPAENDPPLGPQPRLSEIPEIPVPVPPPVDKYKGGDGGFMQGSSSDLPPSFESVEGAGVDDWNDGDTKTEGRPESVLSGLSAGTLMKRGELCRQEAFDVEKERDKVEASMKTAKAQKKYKDALLLKDQFEKLDSLANQLHSKAEERHFRARNLSKEKEIIDVRDLEPSEARRRVLRRICDLLVEDGSELRIVVGGKGQLLGKATTAKVTIRQDLSEHHIQVDDDPLDSSVLRVRLPS